jgi:membrane associated rhomboid family serine protease
MTALTVFAVLSDSYWQSLTPQWRDRLGFAPTNFLDFQWQRLLSSLLLTAGGWKFPASLLMLGACLAMAEHRLGTLATIKLFLTSHVTVLLILSVVILMLAHGVGTPSVMALANSRDIGPSAGYYGCLGAILMLFSGRWGVFGFSCVQSILLVRLVVSVSHLPDSASIVSADAAHLLALPLGVLLAWCGYVRPLLIPGQDIESSGCNPDNGRNGDDSGQAGSNAGDD